MWTKICEFFKPAPFRQDQPVWYIRYDEPVDIHWPIGHYACNIGGVDYVYTAGRTSFTQQGMIAVDEVRPL